MLDSAERWLPQGVESIEDVGATIGDQLVDVDALPASGGRINMPPDMKMPTANRFVGYHRQVLSGGFIWDQFWLWWLYNPKKYVGYGCHEGDWEFVQIASAGGKPFAMTASQHHAGEGRFWWELDFRGGRPVIYVARDSHAHYFQPVHTETDIADGKGMVLAELEWRDFGAWAVWPGRWGNSTGEGKSPQSPGQQILRWRTPHLYHGRSR